MLRRERCLRDQNLGIAMEDYYRLMYTKNGDMVIFTQEPIWEEKWVSVPNKCLISVNKELRITSIESL